MYFIPFSTTLNFPVLLDKDMQVCLHTYLVINKDFLKMTLGFFVFNELEIRIRWKSLYLCIYHEVEGVQSASYPANKVISPHLDAEPRPGVVNSVHDTLANIENIILL